MLTGYAQFNNDQQDFGVTHSHLNSSFELRNGLCLSTGVKSTIDHTVDVKHALDRLDLAKSIEDYVEGGDHVLKSDKSKTITKDESSSYLPTATYKYDDASHTNPKPHFSNSQKLDRLDNLKKAVDRRQFIKDDTNIKSRSGCHPPSGTEPPAVQDGSHLSRESVVKVQGSRDKSPATGTSFRGMKVEQGQSTTPEPYREP